MYATHFEATAAPGSYHRCHTSGRGPAPSLGRRAADPYPFPFYKTTPRGFASITLKTPKKVRHAVTMFKPASRAISSGSLFQWTTEQICKAILPAVLPTAQPFTVTAAVLKQKNSTGRL